MAKRVPGAGSVSMRLHRSAGSRSALDRWENARNKRDIYNQLKKTDLSAKDFAKNDNPLDNQIVIYKVSAQADYESKSGGIYTEGKTFEVIMFNGFENVSNVESKMQSAFSSMVISGDTFNPNFQEAIGRHTNVAMNDIRGLEEVKSRNLSKQDYDTLLNNTPVVRDLDNSIKFSKNKKDARGRRGGKQYNAKLDLSVFE